MKARFILTLVILLVVSFPLVAQNTIKVDLNKVVEQADNQVQGRNISLIKHGDHDGIHLSDPVEANSGVAWITEGVFGNATIELDIRGRNAIGQSFVGIQFNDDGNGSGEVIYLRPFNFSREGRTQNAVQYTFLPDYEWRRLRQEHPGVYESGVDPAPGGDDWVRLKIEIDGAIVHTYVNNMDEPVLSTERLSEISEGRIGLWVGSYSVGDFANMSITTN